MNFPKSIEKSTYFTDSQKSKLLALYNSIRIKDIVEQALEQLDMTENESNPYVYRNIVNDMFLLLSLEGARESLGNKFDHTVEMLRNLRNFFDILCCEDYSMLLLLDKILNNALSMVPTEIERRINEIYHLELKLADRKAEALKIRD